MSIIYNTLERLEANQPTVFYNVEDVPPSPPTAGVRRHLYMAMLVGVMIVLAGAVFILWQSGGRLAGLPTVTPFNASGESVAAEKVGDIAPTVSAAKVITATPESAEAPVVPAAAATETESAPLARTETVSTPVAKTETVSAPVAKAETVRAPVATTAAAPVQPDPPVQAAAISTTQPDGVEELIERSRLTLARGRYRQALSMLESPAPELQNRADYWLVKGSAHLGLGQLDLAEEAFAAAASLVPGNAQIAVQQAILKQELGDHPGALQILEAAAIDHPDVPEIFLNLGYSHQALGAYREAGRSFRAFLLMTEDRPLYTQQRNAVKEWLTQTSSGR